MRHKATVFLRSFQNSVDVYIIQRSRKAPPASLPTIGWLKIDVTDLPVRAVAPLFGPRFSGRSIFLNASQSSLPMIDRVVATGTITFQPGPKGHR